MEDATIVPSGGLQRLAVRGGGRPCSAAPEYPLARGDEMRGGAAEGADGCKGAAMERPSPVSLGIARGPGWYGCGLGE